MEKSLCVWCKEKFNKEKSDSGNKGFTLIELIVAMLVATFVMLAVVFFVTVGTREYGSANSDVALQMESQTALNQVSDIIMAATAVPQNIVDNEDYKVYVMDSITDYVEDSTTYTKVPCCEVFVLDKGAKRLLTAELSEKDVRTIAGYSNDANAAELPDVNKDGTVTLTEQLTATNIVSKAGAIAGDRQKYMLAGNIANINITASGSLVDVVIQLSVGNKTQEINGQYRIRNFTWKAS